MGILNLTPDSFFDGEDTSTRHCACPPRREGETTAAIWSQKSTALQPIPEISPLQTSALLQSSGRNINIVKLAKLLSEGADIIDIGAESTFGPEAQVSADEEWLRLEPVLKQVFLDSKTDDNSSPLDVSTVVEKPLEGSHEISPLYHSSKDSDRKTKRSTPFISLDTYKADVAEKALEMGVQMINDVTALRGDNRMTEVLLKYQPYICLMYSADKSSYATRTDHQYEDVMKTVKAFLKQQAELLTSKGFPKEKIIIDPGLGFFLSADPKVSWEVIDRLPELKDLGYPILMGHSMKSFLGGEVQGRLPASLKAGEKCVKNGASILRVHHVAEQRKVVDGLL